MRANLDQTAWWGADYTRKAAVLRAITKGFVHRPVEEIAAHLDSEEIVKRLSV